MSRHPRLVRALLPLGAVVALAACGSSSASTAGSDSSPTTTISASSGTGAQARCGPVSARTLVSGSLVRVYSLRGTVNACLAGNRATLRLGSSGSCLRSQKAGPVAVAGTLIALASERCGVDTGSTLVLVRRVPGGRTLFAHTALASPGPESYSSVGSIVVTNDGRVAWIAHAGSIVANRSQSAVVARTSHGLRTLDRGAGIVLSSLRLHGSRLSWRDGGARSASLS